MKNVLRYRAIARNATQKADLEQLKLHRKGETEYSPAPSYTQLLGQEASAAFAAWWRELCANGAWKELPEFGLRWLSVQLCLAYLRIDACSPRCVRWIVRHT